MKAAGQLIVKAPALTGAGARQVVLDGRAANPESVTELWLEPEFGLELEFEVELEFGVALEVARLLELDNVVDEVTDDPAMAELALLAPGVPVEPEPPQPIKNVAATQIVVKFIIFRIAHTP